MLEIENKTCSPEWKEESLSNWHKILKMFYKSQKSMSFLGESDSTKKADKK